MLPAYTAVKARLSLAPAGVNGISAVPLASRAAEPTSVVPLKNETSPVASVPLFAPETYACNLVDAPATIAPGAPRLTVLGSNGANKPAAVAAAKSCPVV